MAGITSAPSPSIVSVLNLLSGGVTSDGSPATCVKAIPLDLRLPRIERTSDRDEPAKDAHVRTHDRGGELQSDAQGRASPPQL